MKGQESVSIAESIEKYPYSRREQGWRQSALIEHIHGTKQRKVIEGRQRCKNDEFTVGHIISAHLKSFS